MEPAMLRMMTTLLKCIQSTLNEEQNRRKKMVTKKEILKIVCVHAGQNITALKLIKMTEDR